MRRKTMNRENVGRPEEYSQVCLWPACTLEGGDPQLFVDQMKEHFGVRIYYLEEITTLPSKDENGNVIPNTGGRTDLIFAVHNEDVGKFAVPRLQVGIRWIEDVLSPINMQEGMLWPERIRGYCTWDATINPQ